MLKFWTEKTAPRRQMAASVPTACDEAQGGLVAGNRVATERGWVPVEQIKAGDRVMTFDNGLQTVTGVTRRLYPYGRPDARALPLVVVPAGTLGNQRAMLMVPEQPVLVESDLAEQLFGDAFAPVRASALTALPGVTAMLPEDSVTVVTLGFEDDQAIFVEGQALAICAASRVLAPMTIEEAMFGADEARYPVIEGDRAHQIAASLAPARTGATLH